MRILITNNTLADRAGTEVYVRDLAIALRRRGHEPIAYSPHLGDIAGDLREATIPVTSDLRTIRVAPDVIHGQHHLETMTALMHFPGVPAISVCHGWLPWQENPPRHPRIALYVAVDTTVRDRLVLESGIDPARVRLLLNFVELQRFAPRGELPAKPRRALIFNSHASEANLGALVREACAPSAIDVDLIGYGAERTVRNPESLLAGYDLVFARARSALEALAAGCAVIVADPRGIGGMVTPENLDALREANFGIRTLTTPVSVETLRSEIAKYDAAAAARVCERVRREADIENVVTDYEAIYNEARNGITIDAAGEREAMVAYLRWLSLQTKLPGFVEWNKLQARYEEVLLERAHAPLERELQSANGDAAAMERRFRADIASLRRRYDRLYGVRWFARLASWLRRR